MTVPSRTLVMVIASSFYPPYQGDSVRLLNMIRFLRERGWTVPVLYWHSDNEHADFAAMERLCDGLVVYQRSWLSDDPTSERCDDWCPDEFADLAARIAVERGARAVLAEYAFLSKCLVRLPPGVVRVLDADNVFTHRREVFAAASLDYDWFSTNAAEESRALNRADLILAVQENEQTLLQQMAPRVRVLHVPPAESVRQSRGWYGDNVLFIGADNRPNAEGIRRFVAEALPLIRRAHPRMRLRVVGGVCNAVDPGEGIERLGIVDDLEPIYDDAAIVLNPAPCGTGIKSKTVRALCRGKCLVSTAAGVQGLERYDDVYVRADSPAEFAERIVALLSDRASIAAASRRAHAFAARYFDPEAVFGRFAQALG